MTVESSFNCVYLGFENDCRLSSFLLVLRLTTSSVAIRRWTGAVLQSDVGPVAPGVVGDFQNLFGPFQDVFLTLSWELQENIEFLVCV